MKYLLISAIVLICGANLSRSAKITLTNEYKNSTQAVLTVDITYDDNKEKFNGLNITKDSQVFYTYDKLKFTLPNLSTESSGTYNATLYYLDSGKPKSHTNQTVITVADKEINATKAENATLTASPDKVSKGKDVKLTCTYVLDGKNETFRNLRLSKDNKQVFYSTDFSSFSPVKGVKANNGTYDPKARKVEYTLKDVTDDTVGKYRCEVEYYNGSVTNYHVFSEITLNSGYQHLLSYLLAIPYVNSTNTLINCTALLNPYGEYFYNLSISKDGKQFYKYDINNKKCAFIINNINRTTAGRYVCTVHFNNNLNNYYNTRSFTLGIQVHNVTFITQTSGPDREHPYPRVHKQHLQSDDMRAIQMSRSPENVTLIITPLNECDEDVHVVCSYNLSQINDRFIDISLYKDNVRFLKQYDAVRFEFRRLKGIDAIVNYYNEKSSPQLYVTIKDPTKYTAGRYACRVTFANQTHTSLKYTVSADAVLGGAAHFIISYHISCESIEVIFRHHVYENDLKKTLFNCTVRLRTDRQEVVHNLTVRKDNHLFYALDQNHEPIFTNVVGIESIQPISPGKFVISNPNITTGGEYVCAVDYEINGKNGHKETKMPITITHNLTIKTSQKSSKHNKSTVSPVNTLITGNPTTTTDSGTNQDTISLNPSPIEPGVSTMPNMHNLLQSTQTHLPSLPIHTDSNLNGLEINETNDRPIRITDTIIESIETITDSVPLLPQSTLVFNESINNSTEFTPNPSFESNIPTITIQNMTTQMPSHSIQTTLKIIKIIGKPTQITMKSTQQKASGIKSTKMKVTLTTLPATSLLHSLVTDKPNTTVKSVVTTQSTTTESSVQTITDILDKDLDINFDKVNVSFAFNTNKVCEGSDAYLTCSFDTSVKSLQFSEFNIYKGEHLFLRQVNETFYERNYVKGLEKVENIYKSSNHLVYVRIANVKHDTYGDYSCKATYMANNYGERQFSVIAHSYLELSSFASHLFPSYIISLTIALRI
ncbi:unnamed protein product, partial [Medioppia subpectinata]